MTNRGSTGAKDLFFFFIKKGGEGGAQTIIVAEGFFGQWQCKARCCLSVPVDKVESNRGGSVKL